MSICVCVCVCVCLCVCGVCVFKVYEKCSDDFDIGHCPIKDNVTASQHDFEILLHLPQDKLSSPIPQLWHMLGSCALVCLLIR